MKAKPRWTLQVIAPGNPSIVELGIDWGDGTKSIPVEIEVPGWMEIKPETVVPYFFDCCREREKLKRDLALPNTICFE